LLLFKKIIARFRTLMAIDVAGTFDKEFTNCFSDGDT
jgi:hypothetical protein